MTSTAPALKAAIKTGLLARNVAGMDVTYGAPSRHIGKDVVMLQGIVEDEESASMGCLRREEIYTLTVLVSCVRAFAEDPQPLTERAFALYEELADLLRDDHTVGGVVRTAEVVGWVLEEPANNESGWRASEITARVRCRERI